MGTSSVGKKRHAIFSCAEVGMTTAFTTTFVPLQRGTLRRRSVVLLHPPRGGPGPRERRATFEATPDWAWTCAVVHAHRLDPATDPCLAEQLEAADLVLCADDDLLSAVVACGLHAVAVTGPWPPPDRWSALLEDLHAVVTS